MVVAIVPGQVQPARRYLITLAAIRVTWSAKRQPHLFQSSAVISIRGRKVKLIFVELRHALPLVLLAGPRDVEIGYILKLAIDQQVAGQHSAKTAIRTELAAGKLRVAKDRARLLNDDFLYAPGPVRPDRCRCCPGRRHRGGAIPTR